jgi:hypothetical protein
MHMRFALGVAALAALLATAPTVSAAETTGRGVNVTHVKNLSYGAKSQGTDIEFRKYTIDGVEKTFAFAGSYGSGLQVVDVTDPAASEIVATWDCGVSQGDVQLFQRADLGNRVFVAYTHDDGYAFKASQCKDDAEALGFAVPSSPDGTFIADVTDPYAPKTVSFVSFPKGSHNQTVHPSGRFLYNSNSDLAGVMPSIEIADITDLSAPKQLVPLPLLVFPGLGSDAHDISFSADGKRAYVAALSHTEILDTTNPAAPVSIGKVVDPAINVFHQAESVTLTDPVLGERKFLIIEDEFAGAVGTGQCPNGGVHIYDATGALEKAPVKVGYWNIDDIGPTDARLGGCTAHVFQLHAKEQLMTIAYYNGGVRVVDLSDLVGAALGATGAGMKQLGWYRFKDSNAWSVKAPFADRNGFFMYANDHNRGLDVFRYTPAPTNAVSPGTWLSPEQALQRAQAGRAIGRGFNTQLYCLLV